jgi:hypothetical protein
VVAEVDEDVMPTSVLTAAPSATVLVAALLSTGADGGGSVTAIVKLLVLVITPSVACTVMV